MTRFLLTGDLHLEKGADLGVTPGDRLREQETVWARVLELSRGVDADAILFAGDAFDKASPRPDAILAFERPLVAHAGSVPVVAIEGNHDRNGTAAGTALQVMAEAGLIDLAVAPDVVEVAGVWVVRLPWTSASRLVAAQGGGDRDDVNAQAAAMLVDVARSLFLQIPTGAPSILLTHFSITGARDAAGGDVGLFREIVLPLHDLDAIGFDWIVAGHIHRPQTLGPGGCYVGSPMPLDFGETGFDHGVTILDVNLVGDSLLEPGDGVHATFVPIDSRRLVNIEADGLALSITPPDVDPGDCLFTYDDEIAGAIVKVKITATAEQARRLDLARITRSLTDAGAAKVWKIVVDVERETRARAEGIDETLGELAALDLYITAQIDAAGIEGTADFVRAHRLRALTTRYLEEIQS